MTLADVTRLYGFWKRTPPLRDIVAGFLGVSDKPETPAVQSPALPEFEE